MSIVVKQAETRRAIKEVAVEKVSQTVVKAEEDRQEFLREKGMFDDVLLRKMDEIRGLQSPIAKLNMFIHGHEHQTREIAVTTKEDVFGETLMTQTDDLTPAETKVELQKLKSSLAEFRRSMLAVLVGQNLIADIPSFPEQLRDTWNVNAAAAEIALDVKVI